jgi:hypothetical protein
LSLWRCGRRTEAEACARETLERAREMGRAAGDDAAKAEELLAVAAKGSSSASCDALLAEIARDCLRTAGLTAHEARVKWKPEERGFDLANGLLARCRAYGSGWHPAYLTMTAEVLNDFCAEWVWQALGEVGSRSPMVYAHHLRAIQSIAAQAEGVTASDALRVLLFVVFEAATPPAIRAEYRRVVAEPAAADERCAPLVDRMHKAMAGLHPELPQLMSAD